MAAVAERLEEAGLVAVDGSISGPPPTGRDDDRLPLGHARRPGREPRRAGARASRRRRDDRDGVGDQDVDRVVLQGPDGAPRAGTPRGPGERRPRARARRPAPALPRSRRRRAALLQSIAAKSGRYVGEMEEIAASQEQAGLTPDLFAAFAAVYRELSRQRAGGAEQPEAGRSATRGHARSTWLERALELEPRAQRGSRSPRRRGSEATKPVTGSGSSPRS